MTLGFSAAGFMSRQKPVGALSATLIPTTAVDLKAFPNRGGFV
jgi:hypothetical protein